MITTSFRASKNRGFTDTGLCFVLSRHNHRLRKVISWVKVITFFLLTFILTLVGNFLNIFNTGKGLDLSRNKRIKLIKVEENWSLVKAKTRWHSYVARLRNAALFLFSFFSCNIIIGPTLHEFVHSSHCSCASLIE